ncbi:FHA domain-containing protein [Flagellimonas allohymeniacidonis]|uniref:FHA domain-containing protein n=1 Tax=Flagellimonas allohymeniacidonis TaxID=2517819 RepID=A0A4Q8QAK1_9FLAO|nr:FHA domain-containing protein [Allomuricauda hymeniacidonis]TAI47335.1 FHA domain-containing protein [Allomuricauda hymeniacidonis]
MTNKIHLICNEKTVPLSENQTISLGRKGHGADLELSDRMISRRHAEINMRHDGVFIQDLGSSNGTFVNNKRLEPNTWTKISFDDMIRLASESIQLKQKEVNNEKPSANPSKFIGFKQAIVAKGSLSIGRQSNNDIVLDDPTVTRQHAQLSFENGSFWIQDLGSTNKTYLNGKEVKTKSRLKDSDTVTISFYRITLKDGAKDLRKESSAIKALSIQKKYPNNKIGLQDMSLDIPHSTFVALMGPSGCGKSTLLKCLNGENPATSGEVFIHGLSLADNFNLIKKKIGYVPQDDIVHKELTVYKTLYYAAKLRLPDDTALSEINKRIDKVINDLNLDQDKEKDIRDIKVGNLSGGQRKRVSIAVELLTEPTILFLDEPTSPLDPETIESFLKSLKKLAHSGTTIVMVTHKPEDLNYVDQAIFLGVQGHLVFKGPADLLTSHFEVQNIVEVYSKMSDLSVVSTYYQKPSKIGFKSTNNPEVKKEKPDSYWLQLYWLFSRYLNIKLNDKENLVLLLAQPIIIAGLVCLVFNKFQVGVLFLMAISAIWFGVSNAAKEIVGELSVYRRERMYNLNINTYILSKWMVLSLFALVQTVIFVTIIYLNFRFNTFEGFDDVYLRPYGQSVLFMFFISFSASLIGLWLSSAFNSTEKVMTVVPIALMPQIMLAGVMTKINNPVVEVLSFFTLGRWGTEGFARLQDKASSTLDSESEVVQSVLTSIPVQPPAQGTMEVASSALTVLDLYNSDLVHEGTLIGDVFDSFDMNLLVITLLNILFYVMIYYALKKKDSI